LNDDLLRYENCNTITKEFLESMLRPFFDYENARVEYAATVEIEPVDATTGVEIYGDLNDFLFEWAANAFPFGVESLLEANIKQSAIPKHQFFMHGMESLPVPKGIRQSGRQMTLFDMDKPIIQDTINKLQGLIKHSISHVGAVRLSEIIELCAEIGLYKGNITLYVIGSALRDFDIDNAVFYDGVCYWNFAEVRDISSWFLQAYELYVTGRSRKSKKAALFFDSTGLKERLESIFDLDAAPESAQEKRSDLDTLGMAVVMAGKWVVENLCYPIDFLDSTLYQLLRDDGLYGEKLKQYDAYFTSERCSWLKSRMTHADAIARQKIMDAVGFDPDKTRHGMSNLPKGHYAPVLFSADSYIEAMLDTRGGAA